MCRRIFHLTGLRFALLFVTAATLACGCGCAGVPPGEAKPERSSSELRLLVKPRAGVSLEQLDDVLRSHGARRIGAISQINVHIVALSPGADAREIARKLRGNPHIEFVEFDEKLPPAGNSIPRR